MSRPSVREWQLRSSRTEGGLELLGPKIKHTSLNATLDRAFPALNLKGRSFLVIRLETTDPDGLAATLKQASAWAGRIRISLAIDVSTLGLLDAERRLDTRDAGLLLDDVDASTPPAALLHESLEAVRFRPEFISSARCSLRLEYALEACLGLARNLGLATLGSDEAGHRESAAATPFDYTSRDVAEERGAAAIPHLRLQRPAPDQPRFQLSR